MRRSPRLLVLVLTAVLTAIAGCTGGTDAVDQASGGEFRFQAGTGSGEVIPAPDRKAAPDLTGTLFDGSAWQLSAQRGKVVVLSYWASWCAPCRTEMPQFDDVYQVTKASGVEFFGVAVRDKRADAEAFAKKVDVSYPSLFDQPGKTLLRFKDLRVAGFPFSIVIDKQGRVAAVYPVAQERSQIEPVVTRLAAEG